MANERRYFKRDSIAFPFYLHVNEHRISGESYNISMNGIYVVVSEGDICRLEPGLTGKCQLSLSDVSITLSCQILRVFNSKIALQFLNIPKEQYNLLRAFISFGSKTHKVAIAQSARTTEPSQEISVVFRNDQTINPNHSNEQRQK